MNIKEIEDLIKFVAKTGVSEVSLEQKDFKITIKTNPKGKEVPAVAALREVPVAAPVAPVLVAAAPEVIAPTPATEESKYITVKSPMIGTFYRSPSPDKASFVNTGDEIAPGKVICIIEAMKLFNEIEAEVSGEIVEILAQNGELVEYGQPLFRVKKK